MNTVSEKRLYEGMFLIDSALASSDWDGIVDSIRNIIEREGAEIETIKKWDDRNLAYPIEGRRRGTYILCYFRSEGPKLEEIERNIQLSEQILRALVLKTDKMSEEDIEKPTPLEAAEQRAKQAAENAKEQRQETESDEGEKEETSQLQSQGNEDVAENPKDEAKDEDEQKEGTSE